MLSRPISSYDKSRSKKLLAISSYCAWAGKLTLLQGSSTYLRAGGASLKKHWHYSCGSQILVKE